MLLILLQSFLYFVWNLIKNEDENKEKFQNVGTNKTFHIYENCPENNDLQIRYLKEKQISCV